MSEQDEVCNQAGCKSSDAARARWKLLASMLTTYGYGLMILSALPWLVPVRAPAAWVTVMEMMTGSGLLAAAVFLAPKSE